MAQKLRWSAAGNAPEWRGMGWIAETPARDYSRGEAVFFRRFPVHRLLLSARANRVQILRDGDGRKRCLQEVYGGDRRDYMPAGRLFIGVWPKKPFTVEMNQV
jgi:hypothetical protein